MDSTTSTNGERKRQIPAFLLQHDIFTASQESTDNGHSVTMSRRREQDTADEPSTNDHGPSVRRKRRKLERIIQQSNGYPSFVKLLTTNYDVSDDEDDKPQQQEEGNDSDDDSSMDYDDASDNDIPETRPREVPEAAPVTSGHVTNSSSLPRVRRPVRIDLDQALGLKKVATPLHQPRTTRSMTTDEIPMPVPSFYNAHLTTKLPFQQSSKSPPQRTTTSHESRPTSLRATPITAAEQGYYQGILSPMSVGQDQYDRDYLPPFHQWIRRHLELFSATEGDIDVYTGKRMKPPIVGRVGVRCIHCAQAAAKQQEEDKEQQREMGSTDFSSVKQEHSVHASQRSKVVWPLGAISYPRNIASLFTVCPQKPQTHFLEHCTNIPDQDRQELRILMEQNHPGGGSRKGRPEGSNRIPASLYYTISAKRIGLVDVPDGVRFQRDLSLPPLPFETIRKVLEPDVSSSSIRAGSLTLNGEIAGTIASEPKITADEESERVLAEAVMEREDERGLSKGDDKAKVSDYFFLLTRQMSICHALPADCETKGKRNKLMRIGLAGFCCRYCMPSNGMPAHSDMCGRSFASAADNMPSTVTYSFANHLQKCDKVPLRLKKALQAYKRLHQRQLALKPYGAQRRFIHDLWKRLREADISEEEMKERIKETAPELLDPTLARPPVPIVVSSKPTATGGTRSTSTAIAPPQSRPESLPVCEDPVTQKILQEAEATWDPTDSDNLILPSERWLVSDYVFLTIRHLKVAFPDGSESRSRRVSTDLPGLCCVYCERVGPYQVSPSGRSFPTAPDNFASALNSSLYSHMQVCHYVPQDLKQALAQTRKMHSTQCSSLKFGSQRRYFNILYARLKSLNRDPAHIPATEEAFAVSEAPESSGKGGKPDGDKTPSYVPECTKREEPMELFAGFLRFGRGPTTVHVCRHCRRVPLQLRAPGSVVSGDAIASTVNGQRTKIFQSHQDICRGDVLYLEGVAEAFDVALRKDLKDQIQVLESRSFHALVGACLADHPDLTRIFTSDVSCHVRRIRGEKGLSPCRDMGSKGLWKCLPDTVDNQSVANAFKAFLGEHGESLGATSPRLEDCPYLLNYLSLISPALEYKTPTPSPPTQHADREQATTTMVNGDKPRVKLVNDGGDKHLL